MRVRPLFVEETGLRSRRACANTFLKSDTGEANSAKARFVRPRVDPRFLATDSRCAADVAQCRATGRFVWSGSARSGQGLHQCLAVGRFVGGGEPAEVGEPPAVRDRGDGAVSGIGRSTDPGGRGAVGPTRLYAIARHAPSARRNPSCVELVEPVFAGEEVDSARCAPQALVGHRNELAEPLVPVLGVGVGAKS